MKDKVILLIGKSGSGKTTLADYLCRENGWTQVQSDTDRPKRDPEENGHTFVTPEEFTRIRENEGMPAYTEFSGHRYGATKTQIDNADIYVVDVPGYLDLRKNYHGKELVTFYLDAGRYVRLRRMADRGDDKASALQRVSHDETAFRNIVYVPKITLNAENSTEYMAGKVMAALSFLDYGE